VAVTIDRTSVMPAYYQISLDIRRQIAQGKWAMGAKMPSEGQFMETYGVSRITVRQAIAELVKDGLVTRQRGSGTYVSRHPVPLTHDLSLPLVFARRLRQLGFELTSTTLEASTFSPPFPAVAEKLDVEPGATVAYLKRLMLIDEQPAAVDHAWFNDALCPGLTDLDLIDASLSQTLAQRYGLIPSRTESWLEAIRSTVADSALLETDVNTPLLLLTTILYLPDGTPLEYSRTTWLGDRIRFHFQSGENDPVASTTPSTPTLTSALENDAKAEGE
jgi:DNA-binding GntR family transcriptional regulator